MNGIIVIDKPQGKTSHDIVSMMRKAFHTKRVGHTGTLDPLATGVLPICIGNATKASDILTSSDKRYTAEFELGKRSDTLDIDGKILEEITPNISEDSLKQIISEFIGVQKQLPPMYSAIKQNGKKLYELARAGVEVKRDYRNITIYDIKVIKIDMPKVTVDVKCSKGTYIRSLCDDIGSKCGCGAVMTALRRTETAGFTLDNAYTVEQIDAMDDPYTALLPTDKLFKKYDAIHLNEKQETSIKNGVRMTWRNGENSKYYRLYGHNGDFLCISELKDSKLILVKSFWN